MLTLLKKHLRILHSIISNDVGAWWIPAIMAAKGVMDAQRKKKQAKAQDRYRRAVIQYSPWTRMGDPGAIDAGPGVLGGAISGGMSGMSAQQALGKGGGVDWLGIKDTSGAGKGTGSTVSALTQGQENQYMADTQKDFNTIMGSDQDMNYDVGDQWANDGVSQPLSQTNNYIAPKGQGRMPASNSYQGQIQNQMNQWAMPKQIPMQRPTSAGYKGRTYGQWTGSGIGY